MGQEVHVFGFSHNNRYAYLAVEQATGSGAIYRHDFTTGKREFLYKDDNVDPCSVLTSPLDGSVIALRFLDGKRRVQILNEENEFAKNLAKIGKLYSGKYFVPTSYTASGNLAVIHAMSDKAPSKFLL